MSWIVFCFPIRSRLLCLFPVLWFRVTKSWKGRNLVQRLCVYDTISPSLVQQWLRVDWGLTWYEVQFWLGEKDWGMNRREFTHIFANVYIFNGNKNNHMQVFSFSWKTKSTCEKYVCLHFPCKWLRRSAWNCTCISPQNTTWRPSKDEHEKHHGEIVSWELRTSSSVL